MPQKKDEGKSRQLFLRCPSVFLGIFFLYFQQNVLAVRSGQMDFVAGPVEQVGLLAHGLDQGLLGFAAFHVADT